MPINLLAQALLPSTAIRTAHLLNFWPYNIIFVRLIQWHLNSVAWLLHLLNCICTHNAGLILVLRPANERRRYFVTTSLIGSVQAWNQPCNDHLTRRHETIFKSKQNSNLSLFTPRGTIFIRFTCSILISLEFRAYIFINLFFYLICLRM